MEIDLELEAQVRGWHKEALGKKVVEALKKREFDALYVPTAGEAAAFIMDQ